MVNSTIWLRPPNALLIGQAHAPLERLDAAERSTVLSALLLLTLLGATLVLMTWLLGRATRRYMASQRRTNRPRDGSVREEDWASKPIVPPDDVTPSSGRDESSR